MDTLRALELRHSVRSYTDQPLSGDVLATLQKLVKQANKDGGLHIQLVLDRIDLIDHILIGRMSGNALFRRLPHSS